MKKVFLLGMVVIMLSFVACGSKESTRDKLVGAWYFKGSDSFAFELYEDGKCEIDGEFGTGRWSYSENGWLTLKNSFGDSEKAYVTEVTDDKLIVSNGNSTSELWKKKD